MYLVIAYDMHDDRKRSKVHKWLKGKLSAVQLSVMEGSIPDHLVQGLLAGALSHLDIEKDRLRVWRLCKGCQAKVENYGAALDVHHQERITIA